MKPNLARRPAGHPGLGPPVHAQARPAWGRIAFFGNGSSTTREGGDSSSFSELIANVTFESAVGDQANYEYRADIRLAGYPGSAGRSRRVSVYDAYAGVRLLGGKLGIRGGQMWIRTSADSGRSAGRWWNSARARASGGRWRAALFGGLEPRVMDVGYEDQV